MLAIVEADLQTTQKNDVIPEVIAVFMPKSTEGSLHLKPWSS